MSRRIFQLFPRLAERKRITAFICPAERGDAVDHPRHVDQSGAAHSRRAIQGPDAADHRRGVPHRRPNAHGGISVLMVEHVQVELDVADDAYVIENGQIIYYRTATEFGVDEERI